MEPSVAVITAFRNEPENWLKRCLDSVTNQTWPCTHILVGDGVARLEQISSKVLQVILPNNVGDFGDTPRAVGAIYAIGMGFDAIMFLDADNWYHKTHVQRMIRKFHETNASIITCGREFRHFTDASFLAECGISDGNMFSDTNCTMYTRSAFRLIPTMALMDRRFHVIGDRVLWYRIKKIGLPRAHSNVATVAYLGGHADLYRDLGLVAPLGTKTFSGIRRALDAWRATGRPDLRIVGRYRFEPSNTDRSW